MKKVSVFLVCLVLFPKLISAQLTYVPDDVFEQNLIDLGLDSGPLDDYVATSAIDTVTTLLIQEQTNSVNPLLSLEGIQDFTNLVSLQIFNCSYIYNSTLDLSTLLNLENFKVVNIGGGSYGNVLYPPNLKTLELFDVINFDNYHLDLSGAPSLEFINISHSVFLNSIDFSNSINLKSVRLYECYNQIEQLDLSFCPSLEVLDLFFSEINYLNLKNGNNFNLDFNDYNGSYTNDLVICVDDVYSSFAQDLTNHYTNLLLGVTDFMITDKCATNKITGQVKYDINDDNCVTSNTFLNSYLVNSNDGVNSVSSSLNQNNYYSNFVTEGNIETSVLDLPSYLTASPISETTFFVGEHNVDTVNFCLTATQQINDVSVYFTPLSTSAPGFDATGYLVYKNEGTTTMSGEVSLTFDDAYLNYLSASEPLSSQTNNQLTFDYSNLQPFETRQIAINFNIFAPPTTDIGDTLNFISEITPITTDANDTNNVHIVDQIVAGAYDPNDIRVLEGDEVYIENSDDNLHYIVRFQNTGTAPAVNVNVRMDLDSNLNWNSLRFINSSHPTVVDLFNDKLEFKFQNINLPDSTNNEPESHGYIFFKIKPNNNLIVNDSISETAAIYFDYNPPVITNTATTTFVEEPLGLTENIDAEINLYPVPVGNVLNVDSKNLVLSIEIYNQLGQLVIKENNTYQINLEDVDNGFYVCKVIDVNGNTYVKPIIKE